MKKKKVEQREDEERREGEFEKCKRTDLESFRFNKQIIRVI